MAFPLTRRPRDVDSYRAAGILYGDWGTSKAYVIGLAFALAGYASFWLIGAVSLLSVLIAMSYTVICRLYPNGGGVYASVRNRSRVIALVGAFFLIADYVVTAAISALSAFSYFGVGDPVLFAAVAIGGIALLNYLGPKHTGKIAIIIATITFVTLILLVLLSIPYLASGWKNLVPLQGKPWSIWQSFVGVIVALSGIETIANTTGIMKLNKGRSEKKPLVTHTSTRAIFWVMCEVAIFTTLFSLALSAIPHLSVVDEKVFTAQGEEIRDYVLKFLSTTFAGEIFGTQIGVIFGVLVSVVIGALLLSAVNSSIIALTSLLYLMAHDGELPISFQKLNRFGVPIVPLIIALLFPASLVLILKDVADLADLYAIGFVGAIATNLGFTSTDMGMQIKWRERVLLFFSFLIMFAVELTLFIDKPNARHFVITLVLVGLLLRTLAKEYREKKFEAQLPIDKLTLPSPTPIPTPGGKSILCQANRPGKLVKFAIEKAKKENAHLDILFIRYQKVLSGHDHAHFSTDKQAKELSEFIAKQKWKDGLRFYYAISDSPADTVVAFARELEVDQVIVGYPKRHYFRFLRGNLIKDIMKILPKNIELTIIN